MRAFLPRACLFLTKMASTRRNSRKAKKKIVRNLTIAKETAESLLEDEENGKLRHHM